MEQGSTERHSLLSPEDIEATPVYPVIHMIRADVIHFIDTPLTYEALTAPDLTYTLIHPLLEKYCQLQRSHSNLSVVFCLLLNRVHFIRDDNTSTAALSQSRATLCEILAIRTLRDYGNSMMDLTVILTTSWPVYSGAGEDVLAHGRQEVADFDEEERVGNAIEMAIVGKAKRFIKSSSCQKVIDGIWSGRYVYQAESSHSILSDTYKRTPIHFYDPHKAPLLDHYRLKVPAIRSVLEYFNFLILFVLFIVAIEMNTLQRINAPEMLFMIYALGFTLEKVAAMQEHGIQVYFKGTWNGFDMVFVATYCVYASLRVYGVYHDQAWARSTGVDCLALIACLMFPRLAFVTLKNNLMVLSLRAMMMQFLILMMIAAFCFCGFLYALWTLSRNQAGYSASQIGWWMLDLWFGLDASGFDKSTHFHPIFGPVLMVTYACLSNTLLLTVLVSILSNTFATINEDAAAEAMFRKAVSTIEGVKADSLFSYTPPINLLALTVMLPASYILTPRWFHKVNVFMIRITSFPILLMISLYERQAKKNDTTSIYETLTVVTERMLETLPRRFKLLNFFEGLAGSDADIDTVFEIEDELMESALAPDELGTNGDAFKLQQQRRMSPYSSPNRPQQHQSIGQAEQSSSSSPPRHVPVPGARTRVASLMHRGAEVAQTFASPLQQIFQPLIVDDGGIPQDSPEEQTHAQAHHNPVVNSPVVPSAPSGVSYGPAYRRRLTSMHVRDRSVHVPQSQAQHVRRGSDTHRVLMFPTSGVSEEDVFSSSPDDREVIPSSLPTAEEAEENKTINLSELMERMEKMESRQERIQELLERIAEDVRK
ncbi:receptor-activated Ca2+-permeable cation channel [Mycena belliarum]|uniref:Receptor-activated Ca2+-permeable cation channel n=1 Tax=Mycena belliarum TaxID=1033014 RepID=A0AAD6XNH6_9AGAR|nr:receptor-activated Ca2+-permeable cation channel [Mycena belliae]